jgi:hypothetical protein
MADESVEPVAQVGPGKAVHFFKYRGVYTCSAN